MKRLTILYFLLVFVAQANAQTIPKSIDKSVSPKQQQEAVANNAASAREQVMNKRAGHYILEKKDDWRRKIISSNGYVDISYRNKSLFIKGFMELHYSYFNSGTNKREEEKYTGPFEWAGKFDKRTEYRGGSTGYTFWNGDDKYLSTEIQTVKGEYLAFFFVEVYEKYVYISTGTQSFFFYK